MLEIIIQALTKYLSTNKTNGENIQADVLIWLKGQLTNPKDIDDIDFWLESRNRCTKCGSILTTTYKRDITYIPFKRTEIKHCLNCREVE